MAKDAEVTKTADEATATEEPKPSAKYIYDYWYRKAEDARAKKQALSDEFGKAESEYKSAMSERNKYRRLAKDEEGLNKDTDVPKPDYKAKKYEVKVTLKE